MRCSLPAAPSFSRWTSLLAEAGFHLTEQQILYNRYYWIQKFSKLYGLTHGYDAGVEQQVFKVLESADCDVNWNVIQQLADLVEKEVGSQEK